jgi:signal transduction histidine kinase
MLNRVTAAQAVEEVVAALRAGVDFSAALGTLLGQVRQMLEADEAYIVVREGRGLRLVAADGLGAVATGAALPPNAGLEFLAMSQAEPLVLVDASRHDAYRDSFGHSRPVGAFVACPMVSRGETIGVIVATRFAPGRFGGSDLWWMGLLGGLATVVLEHERGRLAQEHRARQAEVLLDVVSQSGGEPQSLLQRLADTLGRDLGVARVDVLLKDQGSGNLVCLGRSGDDSSPGQPAEVPCGQAGPLDGVLVDGQTYLWTDDQGEASLCAPLHGAGMRSALAAPIVVAGQRRGVLLLSSRASGAFAAEDQAFALVLAARIGVLIEESELSERRRELDRFLTEAKARQEFVGVVSHELKTPVAVIQAYTDVLLRRAEKAGDSANVDVITRIGEQVDRTLHMIDQILDLQRLEAGLMALEPGRFDLVALARRAAEEMATLTNQHRIVVEATEPVAVVADRRRIEEVVTNLLQNALKFSPSGGEITLRVWREREEAAERACFAVSDQGVGIAPAEQPQVFERFYQGQSRLYRGHVGLGLGLYISREIVRRHGGEIELSSRLGEGATFTFWLPVAGPVDDED